MDLREYQKEGIAKISEMLLKRRSAYLADEMGLGKSVQAIEAAKQTRCKIVLIVCPAGLRLNWVRELNAWWPEADTAAILKSSDYLARTDAKLITIPGAVVISYELLTNKDIYKGLCSIHWDMLILDEAHFAKSRTAKRTKAVLGALWDKCCYRLLLSGTPCPNGIIDGFTAFNKLAPEAFPDYYKYGFRYTNATRNWFTGNWEFKGGKNLKELRETLQRSCMVRRTKKAVLSELPDKIYSNIHISVTTDDSYKLDEDTRERIEEGRVAVTSMAVATKRRGLGILKVPAAIDHVTNIMTSKTRCVVFAYHRDVIEGLANTFKGICPTLVISGDTPMKERDQIIQTFQSTGSDKIILVAQITAAGVGITLTASDICVFVELDWTPANMAQAIDRLHRIGQNNAVEVHYLVAQDTMDQQIIESLRNKIESINQVLRHQGVTNGQKEN